jgi:integrase
VGHLDDTQTGNHTGVQRASATPQRRHATYALKRFRETYLPEAIKMESRQSFYSFRHSWRDALRRIVAPPATLAAVGGWTQGKLTSDDYGDKADPDYQAQIMEKISFEGLNLSALHQNVFGSFNS